MSEQGLLRREGLHRWVSVPVRWGDMDAMGHVNNAAYFVYLECARIQLFADLGHGEAIGGDQHGFALVSVGCNFRAQVRYPATIEIGTRVTRIGGSSFSLAHGLFYAGTEELVADAHSVVVWTNYATGKSAPLREAMRGLLEALK